MGLHILLCGTHSHSGEGWAPPRDTITVSGEWDWCGFLWGCGLQRRSDRAFSAFPQTALSSWGLAEMSHCGKGIKVDKRTCFSSEYTVPEGMAVSGRVAFPWHLVQYFPFERVWSVCIVDWLSNRVTTHIWSALQTQGFCTHRLNQADWKYLEKIPKSSKKQSLNLPHTRNYFPLYLLPFK